MPGPHPRARSRPRRRPELPRGVRVEVTTRNKTRGARIRLSGRAIEGWMSITVGPDQAGHGTLYYYGSNTHGGRGYKFVTTDPAQPSPGVRLKAVDRTRTLHLDTWSVAFVRPGDYQSVVTVLRALGLLGDDGTLTLAPRGMGLRVSLATHPAGGAKARKVIVKQGRTAWRARLAIATCGQSPTALYYGLGVRPLAARGGAYTWRHCRADRDPARRSEAVRLRVVRRSHTLHLDDWAIGFADPATFRRVVDGLRADGWLGDDDRFEVAAHPGKRRPAGGRGKARKRARPRRA